MMYSVPSLHALLSALVIGTMAPDFGYFVPGSYVHAHTHTPGSLLWFSLPVGVVVALLLLPIGVAAGAFLFYQNAFRLKHAVGYAAVGGLEGFGLALLLWGALWAWRRRGGASEGTAQ